MLLTHRIRQRAGSHKVRVLDTGSCINPVSVGDVRGYEGSECGPYQAGLKEQRRIRRFA